MLPKPDAKLISLQTQSRHLIHAIPKPNPDPAKHKLQVRVAFLEIFDLIDKDESGFMAPDDFIDLLHLLKVRLETCGRADSSICSLRHSFHQTCTYPQSMEQA